MSLEGSTYGKYGAGVFFRGSEMELWPPHFSFDKAIWTQMEQLDETSAAQRLMVISHCFAEDDQEM